MRFPRILALLAATACVPATHALAQGSPGWPKGFSPPAFGIDKGTGLLSWDLAFKSKADLLQIATGSTTPRSVPDRFGETVNVRDFGAKGDGVTDDTTAFQAAIASATSTTAPRASNMGAMIRVPCGRYILSAQLVATLGTNAAIAMRGDSQACSELQWQVANGGLDFELPQQVLTSASRSVGGTGDVGPGVGIDVEKLHFLNAAPGNVYTGTALRINQPVPSNANAADVPDTIIRDIAWDAVAPGLGAAGQGQNWLNGIELVNPQNTHVDTADGHQWGSLGVAFGPTNSTGIHIVSTGSASQFFAQQVWLNNIGLQGAWRGVAVDGANLQGLYTSNLFLLQNAISIDWERPGHDASASFTLTGGSFDGELASIITTYVRQIYVDNVEVLGGGAASFPGGKLTQNYYGMEFLNTDNIMVSNSSINGICSACATSTIDAAHKGYGLYITDDVSYDGQSSVISNLSIPYGDVGVAAGGAQILVTDISVAGAVPLATQDISAPGGGPLYHPIFKNIQWGSQFYSSGVSTETFNEPLLFTQGTGDSSPTVFKGLTTSNAQAPGQNATNGALLDCASGTSTLSTMTVSLPGPTPFNGQEFTIATDCSGGITNFTASPYGTGITVVGAPSTLTPQTPIKLHYFGSNGLSQWQLWK